MFVFCKYYYLANKMTSLTIFDIKMITNSINLIDNDLINTKFCNQTFFANLYFLWKNYNFQLFWIK